jgi:Na+-translocating ferredoxin:NAD+ oxidoreductase RnfG subunit
MKWLPYASVALCITPIISHASVYLTIDQAQKLMFPHATLQKVAVTLTPEQIKQLKKSSGIYYPFKTDQVYKTSDGGWLVVDQVLGKHEMITYAVGINPNGSVRQVEVLEYNESYGGQVRDLAWRQQFVDKTIASPIALNDDIRNISGATLSSKHLTDGVRRILQFHALVLKSFK